MLKIKKFILSNLLYTIGIFVIYSLIPNTALAYLPNCTTYCQCGGQVWDPVLQQFIGMSAMQTVRYHSYYRKACHDPQCSACPTAAPAPAPAPAPVVIPVTPVTRPATASAPAVQLPDCTTSCPCGGRVYDHVYDWIGMSAGQRVRYRSRRGVCGRPQCSVCPSAATATTAAQSTVSTSASPDEILDSRPVSSGKIINSCHIYGKADLFTFTPECCRASCKCGGVVLDKARNRINIPVGHIVLFRGEDNGTCRRPTCRPCPPPRRPTRTTTTSTTTTTIYYFSVVPTTTIPTTTTVTTTTVLVTLPTLTTTSTTTTTLLPTPTPTTTTTTLPPVETPTPLPTVEPTPSPFSEYPPPIGGVLYTSH